MLIFIYFNKIKNMHWLFITKIIIMIHEKLYNKETCMKKKVKREWIGMKKGTREGS